MLIIRIIYNSCLIEMHLPAFFISFLSSSSLGFLIDSERPQFTIHWVVPIVCFSFPAPPTPSYLSSHLSRLEILESSSPVFVLHFCMGLGLFCFSSALGCAVSGTLSSWSLWCGVYESVWGINFIHRGKNCTSGRDSRVPPAHVFWSSGWCQLAEGATLGITCHVNPVHVNG